MADTTVARIKLALEGATAVERGLVQVEQKVAGVGKALIGLAGGLSVAGFASWVRGAINAADEAAKLAQKTGLAVNEVAGLQLAFRQSGAEATQFVPILAKLSAAAVNGSDALKAMGVQTRNTDGSLKGTRQLLGDVAEKFAGYQDGAAKTALAVKLFGEEGAKILPLLNQGAEGLARYDETARQLGLTLEADTARKAEQFNDTLDLIGQSTQGVARQVAAQLLPTLTTLAGEVFRNATEGDNLARVSTTLAGAMKGLYSVAVGVVTAFQTVGQTLGGVGAAVAAILRGDFAQVKNIISEMRQDITDNWQQAGASIQRVWEGAGDTVVESLAAASAQGRETAPIIQSLGAGAKQVKDEFGRLADQLSGKVASGWADAEAAAMGYNKAQRDFLLLTASPQWQTFSLAQRAQIANLYEKLILQEREVQVAKVQQQALGAAAANAREYTNELDRQVLSAYEAAAAAEEQVALYGLSQVQIAELTLSRLEDARAQALMTALTLEDVRALDAQIAAQKRVVEATRTIDTRNIARESAAEAAREWQNAATKIEDMLTDALMRGFESGKGFGENLADSIVNMFKTFVAREIAKAISQAIMAALAQTQWARFITAALGGGGGGMNANTMMSLANGGGSTYLSALGSSGSALWAGATGTMSAANVAGSLAANYATAGMATSSIAASGAGIDALLATNAAYGTAGAGAAGAGAASAGAGAASSALSAIPVWGWIALAAVVFWDDLFGRKLKEAGSMLKIRGDEITSTGYEFRSGGLFRSDKWTETGDRTAADQQVIQQFRNVQQASAAMAQTLGFSADTINGFSGTVRLNMKGVKTAEEAQQRLNEALEDFQWQLWRSVPGMNMTRDKFREMMQDVAKAVDEAGISTQSMADIIKAGMIGRMSSAQVGQALAEQVLGGIYQTIASPFATQIASAFQAQIITPVFTAILAGVPISQAISQQAIQNVVATAQQAAATLNAIFSDAGFRQAIGDIQNAIGGIAAASVQPAAQVRGLTGAVSTAGNAAAAARAQWKSLADSIIDEIRRIRGEVLGSGPAGSANLQALFATTTARARAGSQDAAAQLPGLSRDLLEAARETSASLSDFRALQLSTMASLQATARLVSSRYGFRLPSFDVGTNYVPTDMVAQVHRGEAIVPARYNPAAGGSDELAKEVKELKAASLATAAAINRLEQGMKKVTNGYNVMRNQEVPA